MTDRAVRLSCFAVAASLALAAPAFAASERCAAVAVSALAEPEWYADECLGGVRAPEGEPAAGPAFVPGDLFYIHNVRAAGPFLQSVVTAPIPTLTYTLLGPNTRPVFAMDFDNAAQVLWGIDNTTRELGTYNLTNGVFTPTGLVTGTTDTLTGLKFDPTSNTVYVSTGANLYTLDLTTRALTLVGPFGGGALMIDIAISNTGQMYGHDIALDNLMSINKTTGAATVIGPTGVAANFAQGMDFDNSDNTLYAFIYTGGGANSLRRFNLTTGAAELIVTGVSGPENEGSVKVSAVQLAPVSIAVDAAGNQVLDPNETVTLAPTWRNDGTLVQTGVTGTLSNFTGPVGPTYTINDSSAAYGDIAAGGTATCTANCYGVTATSATRPAQHWDTTALETLSVPGQNATWQLHVGGSFDDVPSTSPFYRFIETLFHNAVTGGCSATSYCPGANTTREQMAVFVLLSKEGAGYQPAACTPPNLFSDVPETSPFCRYIEELANRNVVTGCGANLYCPTANVTREQMAIFVLRTLDPALNPPACTTPMFSDVPASSPFCRWIEELARRGVVTGCGGVEYCPTAPVTREQMGVFLSVTFGLTLYGAI
jgi:hypothetical protein